jgi:EamA-like transporter family
MGLYFAMLTRGAAVRTTANFYLVPATAAVLTWALLGERMSGFAVLGLVVALAGGWPAHAAPMTAASLATRASTPTRAIDDKTQLTALVGGAAIQDGDAEMQCNLTAAQLHPFARSYCSQ